MGRRSEEASLVLIFLTANFLEPKDPKKMEDSSFSSFPMANWTTRVGGPAGGIFETNAAALVTEQPSPNFASPHTPVGQINLGGGADWDIGSEPPVVTGKTVQFDGKFKFKFEVCISDNKHIVIPLMSFVFGFPVLVITVLCVIQQRNKWLYERQHLRLQQQRRFSTCVGFSMGAKEQLIPYNKSSVQILYKF